MNCSNELLSICFNLLDIEKIPHSSIRSAFNLQWQRIKRQPSNTSHPAHISWYRHYSSGIRYPSWFPVLSLFILINYLIN